MTTEPECLKCGGSRFREYAYGCEHVMLGEDAPMPTVAGPARLFGGHRWDEWGYLAEGTVYPVSPVWMATVRIDGDAEKRATMDALQRLNKDWTPVICADTDVEPLGWRFQTLHPTREGAIALWQERWRWGRFVDALFATLTRWAREGAAMRVKSYTSGEPTVIPVGFFNTQAVTIDGGDALAAAGRQGYIGAWFVGARSTEHAGWRVTLIAEGLEMPARWGGKRAPMIADTAHAWAIDGEWVATHSMDERPGSAVDVVLKSRQIGASRLGADAGNCDRSVVVRRGKNGSLAVWEEPAPCRDETIQHVAPPPGAIERLYDAQDLAVRASRLLSNDTVRRAITEDERGQLLVAAARRAREPEANS